MLHKHEPGAFFRVKNVKSEEFLPGFTRSLLCVASTHIALLCKTLAAAWHRCSSQKQIFRRIHATTQCCIGSHDGLACCCLAHEPSLMDCLQRCKSRIKSEKSLFVLFLCLLVQWASPKPNLLPLRPHSLSKQALRRSIKCLAKESEQLRCRSVATRSACSVGVGNSRAPHVSS